MGRLTRRAFLRSGCGGYVSLLGGLLVACGQPAASPGSGAARTAASPILPISPTVPVTPQPYITYPPLPPVNATVILPTAVIPPNHQTVTLKPTVPNIVPWTPVPSPRPEDPLCYTSRGTRAANLAAYTRISTLVIVATITTIHPPRWSTPDGQRPANPHDPQSAARIFTPVEAQVEQALKGTGPSTVMIVTPVGTIGADCARVADGTSDFAVPGERVVLFLVSPPPVEPKRLDGAIPWWLYERYTITPTDDATNPYQTLPLTELVSIITAATGTPASSPSPAPSSAPVPTQMP